MSHLIQPITVAGSIRCNICQGGKSTIGVITDDYISTSNTAEVFTPCGGWGLLSGSPDSEGEISFGASCGSIVNLSLSSSNVDLEYYNVLVTIYLDGVEYDSVNLDPGDLYDPTASFAVAFTGTPCGVIITAIAQNITSEASSFVTEVSLSITSIT